MISDSINFTLGDGCTLVVYQDSKVEFHFPNQDGYFHPEVTDLSNSPIGKLLREVLLEGPLRDDARRGSKTADSLRGVSNDLTLRKVCEVRVGNGGNVRGASQKTLLQERTEQTLLTSGVNPDVVRYFGSLNGYATALNSSTNAAKAAVTMQQKPGFQVRLTTWLSKNPAFPSGAAEPCDDCGPDTPPCNKQCPNYVEIPGSKASDVLQD